MAFWDDITSKAQELQSQLEGELAKFQNSDFPPAVMAAIALVAQADGKIDAEERKTVGTFITQHALLQQYDALKMRDQFYDFCEQLGRDDEILKSGDELCVTAITKIKGIADQSRTLVKMMISLGSSDGLFDEREKAVVRRVCHMLDINPAEFEL
ncbi:MAG: tellurite resistance TerB family protein [Magnetococcales bacterium]|nr:tellurite resistance TerB family protein [Magnetococcales bacterium]